MDKSNYFPCPRCAGTGVYSGFGTCFRCEGRGACLTKAARANIARRDREEGLRDSLSAAEAKIEKLSAGPRNALKEAALAATREHADKLRAALAA